VGDVFKEQIVKRQITSKDLLVRVSIVIGAIIAIVVGTIIISAAMLFFLVIFSSSAYWLITQLNKEYEYVVTNGELDIDRITNKSRRKRIFSVNIKDFEVMAHVDDESKKNAFHHAIETLDVSSGLKKENTYIFLAPFKGKKVKVIFEPNEATLRAIHLYNPRKVHIKK
jgi:hypothetical protein